MPFPFIFTSVFLLFAASQVYWLVRAYMLAKRRIPGRAARLALCAVVLAVYLLVLGYNFGWFGREGTATRLTTTDALLVAPFLWWAFSSMVAFIVAVLFWPLRR